MRVCRLFRLMLVLLLFAVPGAAQEVKVLSAVKGAQVWFAEDHTVPVVAMTASFPAGSAYDPLAKAGLAAMAGQLLEEGAGSLDGTSFREKLQDKAIELTVDTDRDRLRVHLRVLSGDAKDAFRMLGLALAHPRFDYDAITRIRLSMMQDIDRAGEDPAAVADGSFYALYFGAHAYGHPVGGAKGALAAISREDLRAFAARHWVTGGLKVAICGDVSEPTAGALLKTTFGGLPASVPPSPRPPLFSGAVGLHVMAMNVAQSDAIFALPGMGRNDPDFLAAVLANTILGGGENSRLTKALRESRGLTYDVTTQLVTLDRAAVMVGEVQASPADMRRVLSLVRETLRQFAMKGPTAQEYADAKSYMRGSFALQFTSNADSAATLVQLMEDGRPVDYIRHRGAMVDAISMEDVKRAARRLFASDKLTVVVAGSAPARKRSSNPFRN